MYEIDGIKIGDVNYDKVCLNCRYWQANVQLKGAANGMACTRGQGQTNPDDSCSLFLPNQSLDSMQDPNMYFDKRNKIDVWKL